MVFKRTFVPLLLIRSILGCTPSLAKDSSCDAAQSSPSSVFAQGAILLQLRHGTSRLAASSVRRVGDGCVPSRSLTRCEPCLGDDQCQHGAKCSPTMKRCIADKFDVCPTPSANCRPACREDANFSSCSCDNEDFPVAWQFSTCSPTPSSLLGVRDMGQVSDVEWEGFKLLIELRAQGYRCPDGREHTPNAVNMKFDCKLWRASRLHSQDMADNNYFSHDSQDGRTPWDRAEAQGTRANGENIAAGAISAASTMEQWKSSVRHCNNMMDSTFKAFALGHGSGGEYQNYWTQMFANDGSNIDSSCYSSPAPRPSEVTPTRAPPSPGATAEVASGECEESFVSSQGEDYRGCQTKTVSGRTCQAWDSQVPTAHPFTPDRYPNSGLDGNKCRNPDNDASIWCYIADERGTFEYCKPLDAATDTTNRPSTTTAFGVCDEAFVGNGFMYRGCQTKTRDGLTCQKWALQEPHSHRVTSETYPDSDLQENYCRNPTGGGTSVWCYTTNPNKRWDYCDPIIEETTTIRMITPPPTTTPVTTTPVTTTLVTTIPATTTSCVETLTGNGASYRGCQDMTRNGHACQAWNEQHPHKHSFTSAFYPDDDLVSDYCRNPDGDATIWCIIDSPQLTWEYCDPIEGADVISKTPSQTQPDCIQSGSLGMCEMCLHSNQCAGGRQCDSSTKRCTSGSETCSEVGAGCQPRCGNDDDSSTCQCANPGFPSQWQSPTCEGDLGGTGTTESENARSPMVSVLEWQNYELLNELRAQGYTCPGGQKYEPNLVPLKFDCALWRASFLHSQDMADQAYFDHVSKDGRSPNQRAAQHNAVSGGENIAAGNPTAAGTLEMWKNSDGHCNNLMQPTFRAVAIGHASGGPYGHYWTQMFAYIGDSADDTTCHRPPSTAASLLEGTDSSRRDGPRMVIGEPFVVEVDRKVAGDIKPHSRNGVVEAEPNARNSI